MKMIAVVLLVAMTAMLMHPGQAEAIEPLTVITIAGAAVLVITIVVVLIIANVRDSQKGEAAVPALVAYDAGGVQGM